MNSTIRHIIGWNASVWTTWALLLSSALANEPGTDLYVADVKPLLKTKCVACHGALKQESGLRLDTGAFIRAGGDSGPAAVAGKADESLLLERVMADDGERMPPEGEPLTAEQVAKLRRWIEAGAASPGNEVTPQDPREHWAFQPVEGIDLPASEGNPVDQLVRARLSAAQLSPAPEAPAATVIRRMYLDLHGLPPTVEEFERWQTRWQAADSRQAVLAARRDLVDELLASPRYGERWAQHWLDVVRYADTHGFEVNTPRENAWPYRDYVIRAFNEDLPYDQFIQQQLAGDALGEDAATGFLVAAPVLLPGQIGKDDASIRLARQDSLDEIIVGTTATALGLTVGCARCHDHKFDPISQRDYYSFQAFFAGVAYGDRAVSDDQHRQRLSEAQQLVPRIEALQKSLLDLEPLAAAGRVLLIDDEDEGHTTHLMTKNGHGVNPAGTQRGYRDDVGDGGRSANVSLSRYTWWDNVAGRDTFTWNPQTAGRFRIWISWGVHGSGVHTRDARYVLDEDGDLQTVDDQTEIARADQYYFADVSQGESEKLPLWSGFADAGVHSLTDHSKLVLRGGETGTGITADAILLVEAAEEGKGKAAAEAGSGPLRDVPVLRAPVSAKQNIERFPPTRARFLRFTSLQTIDDNRHQPCIDELEVFRANSGENVALASRGAIATSSGNYSETGIHQLKHVNDGKYGNSWSWISNEYGRGWVQLEFAQVETIDRVIWGRDRLEQFKDRLPIRYVLEASLDGKTWTRLASHEDRQPRSTPFDATQLILRASSGLGGVDIPSGQVAKDVEERIAKLAELNARKAELEKPRMVYAGVFREPDMTQLLNRGDPEQPLETVSAQIPAIFGSLEISNSGDEQSRRLALARWLTRPDHPLTARVMVNRVWQGHFGRGIVSTPSDFGLNGSPPSHPELLDDLADYFVTSGWSIKGLHRLIMTSDTYCQASQGDPRGRMVDRGNRLLWRFAPRRLEGEAIRDSILYVSDGLNLQMGGPGFDFFKTRGGLSGFPPVEEFNPANMRRMIYAHKIRMEPVPVFGVFDCPDAGQPTPRRTQSTTPIQALNLLNSPFVLARAEALADIIGQQHDSLDDQVTSAFQRTLLRLPSAREQQVARQVVDEHGLTVLCRALFNSNEFLFIP